MTDLAEHTVRRLLVVTSSQENAAAASRGVKA